MTTSTTGSDDDLARVAAALRERGWALTRTLGPDATAALVGASR